MNLIDWLTPWEFSPTLVLMFILGGWLFIRGQRVHRVTLARQFFFWAGVAFLYLSMHTRIDYYAERMFFIHRLQHLVLHHLGPLLIMGAYPGQVLRAGLPMKWRYRLRDFRLSRGGKALEAVLTNKIFVPFLFVILVLGFLIPTVQFYSMLDWRLYRFMNWSVVISGFMYWNLILDRRPSPPAVLSPGGRILSPVITMVPQMVVGAIITFTEYDLYPIFDLCGRAIPGMSAITDQAIGGLTMWVLAGFVEVFGLLFALSTLMRLSARNRLPNKQDRRRSRHSMAAPVS
ncbi:cytochrome c oxidase assembly protein [Parapusillimonas granuli]|uniref:Cytochrome c oxidase assembly protein n=1 Tax=Parapusillimonas granuli TaxID=380911 RepID=A0A853FXQ3_9BURK|nr:cytochrome c oxidase assembly protein [Parapusillimonas granuli]MBB5215074.1 putative membrane protein [Parapusillimonas granuli]MEB2401381.1 cytochrome c oxidase assembly protein [Alcaligenaceae bacterium]NYT49393.1 cytochrome c oxidase assembly protein [Parapusillimonas granuli]